METVWGQLVVKEKTMQRILDFLPYPFIVSRNSGDGWHNVFVNAKFVHEIGYCTEQIPTLTDWFKVAYPDETYRASIATEWNERVLVAQAKSEDAVTMQVMIQTKHNGRKWYEVKASMTDDMHMVAFIDIDDVKVREENLKLMNENRDRILSILGHDLRGPISNLHVLSRMLLDNQVTKEEFIHMISEINSKAFKTMEFLSTTLAWAKSNFDTFSVRKEEINLKEIFSTVVSLYSDVIAEKSIVIDPELVSVSDVHADREMLTSVLRNLLSNAIKFSHRNGRVSLRAHRGKDHVFIEVEDEGTGIAGEMLSQINANKNISTPGTQGEKGLGIGLLLSRDLLRRIGGELRMDSTPGKGTLARVILPRTALG